MADHHLDRRQVLRALLLGGAGLAVPAACGLPTGGHNVAAGILVGTFVIVALAFCTIYQATVKFSLWRLAMDWRARPDDALNPRLWRPA